MINKFGELISKLTNDFEHNRVEEKLITEIEEIKASQLLQGLTSTAYIPMTSSAISLSNIRFILNDIVLNRRESIIEFGSGISTLIIANLIKLNNLNCNFYSVEQDKNWYRTMESFLRQQCTEHLVELVHAPLIDPKKNGLEETWYSISSIRMVIPETAKFDCALVDGPTAYTKDTALRRVEAGKYLFGRLCTNSSVFVDDIDREGEAQIIAMWEKDYHWKMKKLSNSMSVCLIGESLNIS